MNKIMDVYFGAVAMANTDEVFGLILMMAIFVSALIVMTGVVNFALWLERKLVVEPFRKKYGFKRG